MGSYGPKKKKKKSKQRLKSLSSNGFHVKFDICEGKINFIPPTIVPPRDIKLLNGLASSDTNQVDTPLFGLEVNMIILSLSSFVLLIATSRLYIALLAVCINRDRHIIHKLWPVLVFLFACVLLRESLPSERAVVLKANIYQLAACIALIYILLRYCKERNLLLQNAFHWNL